MLDIFNAIHYNSFCKVKELVSTQVKTNSKNESFGEQNVLIELLFYQVFSLWLYFNIKH